MAPTASLAAIAAMLRASTLRPANTRYCLGAPPPARSPVPAATMSAETGSLFEAEVKELLTHRPVWRDFPMNRFHTPVNSAAHRQGALGTLAGGRCNTVA